MTAHGARELPELRSGDDVVLRCRIRLVSGVAAHGGKAQIGTYVEVARDDPGFIASGPTKARKAGVRCTSALDRSSMAPDSSRMSGTAVEHALQGAVD